MGCNDLKEEPLTFFDYVIALMSMVLVYLLLVYFCLQGKIIMTTLMIILTILIYIIFSDRIYKKEE